MDYQQLIDDFGAAFNRHDADALVAMMTDDCVFYTLAGEEVFGKAIHGKQAVQAAFEAVWHAMPDAHWEPLNSFVSGNNGLSFWRFTGTNSNGETIDAQGCDILTFQDGKIAVKNAFRKDRPLQQN